MGVQLRTSAEASPAFSLSASPGRKGVGGGALRGATRPSVSGVAMASTRARGLGVSRRGISLPGDAASVDFFEVEGVRGDLPFCFGGLGGDLAGGVLFEASAVEAEVGVVGRTAGGLIAEVAQKSIGALVVVKLVIVANVSATIGALRRPGWAGTATTPEEWESFWGEAGAPAAAKKNAALAATEAPGLLIAVVREL